MGSRVAGEVGGDGEVERDGAVRVGEAPQLIRSIAARQTKVELLSIAVLTITFPDSQWS